MEAPEKIYLQPISKNEIYNHWYRDKLTNDFIEYFRTDAFIEKACKWLEFGDFFIENYLINDSDGNPDFQYEKFINDFKKVMEE